jgi:hypothetical protein
MFNLIGFLLGLPLVLATLLVLRHQNGLSRQPRHCLSALVIGLISLGLFLMSLGVALGIICFIAIFCLAGLLMSLFGVKASS